MSQRSRQVVLSAIKDLNDINDAATPSGAIKLGVFSLKIFASVSLQTSFERVVDDGICPDQKAL